MKKTYIWHLILVLYIAFIFTNSLTPADISGKNSGFVLEIAHRVLSAAGIEALWLTDHVIRKCAHFTEYAVLGAILYQSRGAFHGNENLIRQLHPAAIFFVPFVDETLQLFTEGRSGQISDVWLDMGGAVCGTVLFWMLLQVTKKYKNKMGKEKIG